MIKRTLGKTGLEVTVLGHGAMEVRGEDVSEDEADRILNAVLDGGINFIDTAYDYGMSEERIGKFISRRRSEFFLATKCGCTIEKGHVWTRENLLHNIETSLSRMKTDYVDIWQMHNPSVEEVRGEDLVKVMEEVKASGKVRHISISSTLPHITTYIGEGNLETYQIPYSALYREHEDVIGVAADAGVGTIIRGGVEKGEPGVSSREKKVNRWDTWEKAKLDDLLSPGESRTAFLLRFTITHPGMHTTIVGTRNPDHLAENIKTMEVGELAADVYQEAKRRLDEIGEKPEAVE